MKQESSKKIVNNMFDSQKEFIVLGLCGKTGSGVSEVSNILCTDFDELNLPVPCEESKASFTKTEYRLLYNFANKNWKRFYKIKTSSLILSKAIQFDEKEFCDYIMHFIVPEYSSNPEDDERINDDNKTTQTKIQNIIDRLYNKKITINFDKIKIGECPLVKDIFTENAKKEIKETLEIEDLECDKTSITLTIKQANALFYKYLDKRNKKEIFNEFAVYEILYQYIFKELPNKARSFWKDLTTILNINITTIALQDMGNNLRVTKENPLKKGAIKEDGYSGIAELINISIKLLRDYKTKKIIVFRDLNTSLSEETEEMHVNISKEKRAFIVIDSIKNPYESMYLKKRYSNYYLVAIYTDEKFRKERLEQNKRLEQKEIQAIDITEQLSAFKKLHKKYTKAKQENAHKDTKKDLIKDIFDNNERIYRIVSDMDAIVADSTYPFIMQNIEDCIDSADIFINNKDESNSFVELKKKILRYVCLIMYPGLVLPSDVERCMQTASTAKLCSGCISRQVGAVLTDSSYNLVAIGWNQQPEQQVPCLYRDIVELRKHCNQEAYSDYENDDKRDFQKNIKDPVDDYYNTEKCIVSSTGRSLPYCFKDIYNEITGEKNQVYTRALHAEETAFINLNKTGAKSIKDGFLFTTSSPCELCSKKAMHMGIKRIYYIQPYPGISNTHVLSAGDKDNRPELELYTGAIGRAYTQLYTPLIPKKDELELWLGHKVSIINYCKNEDEVNE